MLTGEDGLPLEAPPAGPITFPRDGILADDPGHRIDISSLVRAVFEGVFGAGVDRIWAEAAQILGNSDGDLRPWLRRSLLRTRSSAIPRAAARRRSTGSSPRRWRATRSGSTTTA